jgi:mRNA interferase RelE/StbE
LAYSIGYKKSVQRDLKQLSKTDATRILDLIEKELLKKPDAHPMLKGKFAGLRKYRVGDHRVIYSIVGTEVRILRIGNRRDVYKRDI